MIPLSMEVSSTSSANSEHSSSFVDHLNLFIFRPILALLFVLSFILIGWFLAWKLVLVHAPLVQEVFGLKPKPPKPKPPARRLSKFYSSMNALNSTSAGVSSDGLKEDQSP